MNFKESQTIELKESWRDEYLKTVAAFANTDGGMFYIGVDDKGQVVGVDRAKKLLDDLPNKVTSHFGLFVGVDIQHRNGLSYIEMSIPKSPTPVAYNGKFYIRCGSTTQELKGNQLHDLILKSRNMTWDEVLETDANWDDIDNDTVRVFIRKAVQYNRLPEDVNESNTKELFEKLKLSRNGILTRAAVLLFSKYPTRFRTMAICKIGRFSGNSFTNLVTDDVIECPLFRMPDRIMERLLAKYLNKHFSYKGLQRIEMLEYPEIALREAILNAVIHRDYSGNSFLYIKVFDNSMTLWNEGELISPLSIESLYKEHQSIQRNKLIADIFYRAGYIEAWGRGTVKMIENSMNEDYEAPKFEESQGGVKVIFEKRDFENDLVDEPINDENEPIKPGNEPIKLENEPIKPENEPINDGNEPIKSIKEIILEQIEFANDRFSILDIAEIANKSVSTVKRNLTEMRKEGIIGYEGSKKSGRYYLKEKDEEK